MEDRFGSVGASEVLRCNSTIRNQAFNISFYSIWADTVAIKGSAAPPAPNVVLRDYK